MRVLTNLKRHLLKLAFLGTLITAGIPLDSQSTETVQHPPLLKDLEKGNFKVDPGADKIRPILMLFSKMAFLMRKKDPLAKVMTDKFSKGEWCINNKFCPKDEKGKQCNKGCEVPNNYNGTDPLTYSPFKITPFKGKSGFNNTWEDEPGFVAFSKSALTSKTPIMIVTFRGSDSSVINKNNPGYPGCALSADWEVNLDHQLIEVTLGKDPKGKDIVSKFHRGFFKKTQESIPDLWNVMKKYIDSLSDEQKAKLQIWFTGHSQGAALAPLAAAFIAEKLKEIFGPNFSNKDSNTIKVYVFSAPRALGDVKALQWFEETLGKHNVIRQNVIGIVASDIVTVASFGKTSTALLQLTPIMGQYLAETFGGGSEVGAGSNSFGYLAGDDIKDIWKRLSPELIVAYSKKMSGLGFKVLDPKTAASLAWLAFQDIFGATHYGGTLSQTGKSGPESSKEVGVAYTSLLAMEGAPSVENLLKQGYEKQNKGDGFFRKGIEKVASIKVAAECFTLCNQLSCKNPSIFEICKKCPADTVRNCTAAYKKGTLQKNKDQKETESAMAKCFGVKSSITCSFNCTQLSCKNKDTFETCKKSCPAPSIKNCTAAYEESVGTKSVEEKKPVEKEISSKKTPVKKLKCTGLTADCTRFTCTNPERFEECQRDCSPADIKNCTAAHEKAVTQQKKGIK